MLFRLSNVPASFEGYINKIFTEKLDVFVIVYLKNILIYTEKTGQPYIEAVYWVLDQLQTHWLFANLKKYCSIKTRSDFLATLSWSREFKWRKRKSRPLKLGQSLNQFGISRCFWVLPTSTGNSVLICGIHVFSQLCQFWNEFWTNLNSKRPYKVSIGEIWLRLTELHANNQ